MTSQEVPAGTGMTTGFVIPRLDRGIQKHLHVLLPLNLDEIPAFAGMTVNELVNDSR
jgi:hypothetical protein